MLLYEYKVSQRVTLRRGDLFKVSGGPRLADGGRLARPAGPYKFSAYRLNEATGVGVIECFDRHHACAVLHVTGDRPQVCPGVIPSPYRVTGKKRSKPCRKQ